jgi:hypothetical protein
MNAIETALMNNPVRAAVQRHFEARRLLESFIHNPFWRRVLDHPMQDRFDRATFARGLEQSGFVVEGSRELMNQFAWFVARKPG